MKENVEDRFEKKAYMMFAGQHHVFGARLIEQIRPKLHA